MRWGPFTLVLLVACAAYAVAHQRRASGALFTGIATVIDGDTIVIAGRHIRLAEIDAPESDQSCNSSAGETYPCGRIATAYMVRLTVGKLVRCRPKPGLSYGRMLAYCSINGRDLGETMVSAGMAIDYVRYDRDGRYAAAQREARQARCGIWQGSFVEPEQWRHADLRSAAPND